MPTGARMAATAEPSAAAGLSKLLRLFSRGAGFLGQYLPSWLPRWEYEDGKHDMQEQGARRRRAQRHGLEITACSWHPDQNFLALAVWRGGEVPNSKMHRGQGSHNMCAYQDHDEEFVCIFDMQLNDYWRFPQTPSSDPIILRDECQVSCCFHFSLLISNFPLTDGHHKYRMATYVQKLSRSRVQSRTTDMDDHSGSMRLRWGRTCGRAGAGAWQTFSCR